MSLAFLSLILSFVHLALPAPTSATTESVAAAWYAGWHATRGFPLSSISWSKYNTIIYSFAITTSSPTIFSLDGSDPSLLVEFVSEAHKHGVAAHVALGGWTGSIWFSSNVATPESRTAFVKTIANFSKQYDIDGINFDWESPNQLGVGCNTMDADDTQNFLLFLQELRANPVGTNLTLSAATGIRPFLDASGNPLTNVSGFAEVFDYVTVMNYDIWGSWSPGVGPNAPLDDGCAPPGDQMGFSAVSAVGSWIRAGMPLDKIVLGVPSYGHSFSVLPSDAFVYGSNETELAAYPKFDTSKQPVGDTWDDAPGIDVCGVYEGPGGIFNFWGLIAGGFLTRLGKPAPGIYYRYDSCSQTPYVYNKTSGVMVSFDDAQSFAAKGSFIKETGLRGFAMWEAGGDYHDILLDSIRNATGH